MAGPYIFQLVNRTSNSFSVSSHCDSSTHLKANKKSKDHKYQFWSRLLYKPDFGTVIDYIQLPAFVCTCTASQPVKLLVREKLQLLKNVHHIKPDIYPQIHK